jgi:hypothetical protein
LTESLPALSKHFANENEIDPPKILPRLEIVESGGQKQTFEIFFCQIDWAAIHRAIGGQCSFKVRAPMNRPIWPPGTVF